MSALAQKRAKGQCHGRVRFAAETVTRAMQLGMPTMGQKRKWH